MSESIVWKSVHAVSRRPVPLSALSLLALLALLTGCASAPPSQVENLCGIFQENRSWYRDAQRAEQRWGVPIAVKMSFAYQESSYRARAKPPRNRILGFIPGRRPSSAYGYAQATNEAWADYVRATGRTRANRRRFGDAMDFVGWYNRRSADTLNIPRNDARRLYLAYHEGMTGYRRGTYRGKPWLQDVAVRVQSRASTYQSQLDQCESRLQRRWWPFG